MRREVVHKLFYSVDTWLEGRNEWAWTWMPLSKYESSHSLHVTTMVPQNRVAQ